MTLLEQASALLAEDGPFTLAQAKALDALCEQARDEEADLMGDLWEAAMAKADEEALHYMTTFEDEL
ncbi:hypothetical protein ACXRSW_00465 [Aeromonas dhakensis]|uniref:hypothetical protein n=1 Tax=Aeromonas dhakensis TaxID=196024 RepID=UPI0020B2EEE5|nr:hypothetical protein [Aeromonas dhakensis]CAD7506620.1 hypothetical protein KBAD11_20310 [Aeromonas dhakensis]CAD7510230.1 hypothetical protein KBAD03_10220 [Aeromonas dhakensis]CAD7520438.1 hypothetical protein KBAD14_KBAD14_20320 [Aeromonas dhakensis]CAD7520465.1 hypothetical protein KBAD10_20330 [Aeromonas dhakensis]CAD7525159.1 hypothetical protein KBAD05_20310 [Aeromonas dhakensis]